MSLLREVNLRTTGPQKQLIFKTLADSSGNINMNVDGSTTEKVFFIQPPTGEVWRISSWSMYVQDSGSFDASKWGNGVVMTNGLMPKISINGVVSNMLDFGILNTGDLSRLTHNFNHLTMGTGDEIVTAEWDFIKEGQYLRLTENDQLQIVVRDNLSALVKQATIIRGYKE